MKKIYIQPCAKSVDLKDSVMFETSGTPADGDYLGGSDAKKADFFDGDDIVEVDYFTIRMKR